ncbi:MAG: D-threitol dehydrogenase [Succinivibrio sp.]|nr:D-threitol dehydrogenase [Succinivibrio sp.]
MSTDYDVNLKYGVDPNESLEGKVAVVTGGFGGIAMASNRLMYQKGAKLALLYPPFEAPKKEATLKEFGDQSRVVAIECDVTSADSVRKAFAEVKAKFGTVDILVTCAGYVMLQPMLETELKEWETHMAVNLTGTFLSAQEAARIMTADKHGGKIIFIASQAATVALDNHVAYATSKAGVLGMSKVMSKELAPYGICVNTISPTVVLTPMGAKAWDGQKGEDMKKMIPMGRFAYTDEIGAAVLFLASNGSDMITGVDILIDGGYQVW